MLHLLEENGALLVLAALVLEPHPDDAGRQPRHLGQLLLHEGVGTRVGVVARAKRVQLLLVQDGSNPRRLVLAFVVWSPLAPRLASCWVYNTTLQYDSTTQLYNTTLQHNFTM